MRVTVLLLLLAVFNCVLLVQSNPAEGNYTAGRTDPEGRAWTTPTNGVDQFLWYQVHISKAGSQVALGVTWTNRFVITASAAFPNHPPGLTAEDETYTITWPLANGGLKTRLSRSIFIDNNPVVKDRIPIAIIEFCPTMWSLSYYRTGTYSVGYPIQIYTFAGNVLKISSAATPVAEKCECHGSANFDMSKDYYICIRPLTDALGATELGAHLVDTDSDPQVGYRHYGIVTGLGDSAATGYVIGINLGSTTVYNYMFQHMYYACFKCGG